MSVCHENIFSVKTIVIISNISLEKIGIIFGYNFTGGGRYVIINDFEGWRKIVVVITE